MDTVNALFYWNAFLCLLDNARAPSEPALAAALRKLDIIARWDFANQEPPSDGLTYFRRNAYQFVTHFFNSRFPLCCPLAAKAGLSTKYFVFEQGLQQAALLNAKAVHAAAAYRFTHAQLQSMKQLSAQIMARVAGKHAVMLFTTACDKQKSTFYTWLLPGEENIKAVQGTLCRAQFYQSLAASRLTVFVYCICTEGEDDTAVLHRWQVVDDGWKLLPQGDLQRFLTRVDLPFLTAYYRRRE